jgi:hypothetical protein
MNLDTLAVLSLGLFVSIVCTILLFGAILLGVLLWLGDYLRDKKSS